MLAHDGQPAPMVSCISNSSLPTNLTWEWARDARRGNLPRGVTQSHNDTSTGLRQRLVWNRSIKAGDSGRYTCTRYTAHTVYGRAEMDLIVKSETAC